MVGGNISLKYLPVSFNQAVGATTPFFTALFAYLMTRKKEAWATYTCLVPVVAGVVIASGVRFPFFLDLVGKILSFLWMDVILLCFCWRLVDYVIKI